MKPSSTGWGCELSLARMPPPAIERVASVIDHTLLDASAGAGDIDRLCGEASRFGFAAVCVHGRWVARCAGRTGAARVAAVVSFPHGLDATSVKEEAALRAVADGLGPDYVLMARLHAALSRVPVVIINPDAEEGARHGDAYLLADYDDICYLLAGMFH